jgi:hypothetical protein
LCGMSSNIRRFSGIGISGMDRLLTTLPCSRLARRREARSSEGCGWLMSTPSSVQLPSGGLRRRLTPGCRIVPLDKAATWALFQLIDRAGILGVRSPEHYLFPFCRFRQTKNGQTPVGRGYESDETYYWMALGWGVTQGEGWHAMAEVPRLASPLHHAARRVGCS